MNRARLLRTALLVLLPVLVTPLYGQGSCNRTCPGSANPCERSLGKSSETGLCVYGPADGAVCNHSAEGDGVCFDRKCESAQCQGVDFFQGCDAPMEGGWEGACIANLCASAAPIDECVKPRMGRINCCSQDGCRNAYGVDCTDPSGLMNGSSCDPSHLEPPGLEGQTGVCDDGACVPTTGDCAGVRCGPVGNGICARNDLNLSTCECETWVLDGRPLCNATLFCAGPDYCVIFHDPTNNNCPLVHACSADCEDNDPCTRDFCDSREAIDGSCGPGAVDCCVNFPEPAGTVCEVPGSPGQWGYCSSEGACEAGPARNEISMGCTHSFDTAVKLLPFELQLSPENQRVPASTISLMTVGGVAYLPQSYLDELQILIAGGVDKVDVRGAQATAVIQNGATGPDVVLAAEPIAYTCALGASVPCDPANDFGGVPGHRANTDCTPTTSWNTCGQFVSLPISSDCGPGGVCATGDWNQVRQGQCARNGFCVIGRVGLELQDQATMYETVRTGHVQWGWDDQNTGATVQSGGPNDGTWVLPPAVYSDPLGPNSLRLIFVNSVSGHNSDVALECTMGVDSQGRHGVYSADPLSSPTPSRPTRRHPACFGFVDYDDPQHSTLAIFPTGLLEGPLACVHVAPDATTLSPSSLCDIGDADGAHAFEIHYDDVACSFPLDIDWTQTLPIDPGGNFGLDPVLSTHFDGRLKLGGGHAEELATGTARDDAASCGTSWGAERQQVSIPEGTTCDWQNAPCALDCASAGCTQVCTGPGVDCEMACPGGGCSQTCADRANCAMACPGGGCSQTCAVDAPGANCTMGCGGGGCTTSCRTLSCPDPGECNLTQCLPGPFCNPIPLPDGTDCDVGLPVPAACSAGACDSAYDSYVEEAIGLPGFFRLTYSSGSRCCYRTPISTQLLNPTYSAYVDPALCDSFIEDTGDGRFRLRFASGGAYCCGNTIQDVLDAYPNREICDGRTPNP